jgi:hypothetical protein
MRYVIIAILIYLVYLLLRNIVRNISAKQSREKMDAEKKNRKYDMNRIQDAEFREVKKD